MNARKIIPLLFVVLFTTTIFGGMYLTKASASMMVDDPEIPNPPSNPPYIPPPTWVYGTRSSSFESLKYKLEDNQLKEIGGFGLSYEVLEAKYKVGSTTHFQQQAGSYPDIHLNLAWGEGDYGSDISWAFVSIAVYK